MDDNQVAAFGQVVAIGASAGGVSALIELIAELPADFRAPVVIAMHSTPESRLTSVLDGKTALAVKTISDGERLEAGTVFVVPGAKHAFFGNGRIHLSEIVEKSGFRPSIDALFMTLAAEYRERAVAVVLSGSMKDGMRGAQVVYDTGGRTIVQDPEDANHASMPNSVIFNDHPHEVLSASDLGIWLREHVGTGAEPAA